MNTTDPADPAEQDFEDAGELLTVSPDPRIDLIVELLRQILARLDQCIAGSRL